MIYVGIDVAKDKHDCLIVDSDGVIIFQKFTIPNNKQGFDQLLTNLKTCGSDSSKMKVGLEATGHYSDNLLEFLISNDLPTTVINPLHTNLYRKSLSLRKTKTDTVDALSIATMLRTESLEPYSQSSYQVRELKSLTRYRFSLVQDCSRLKTSYARLCVILFPEGRNQKIITKICLVTILRPLSMPQTKKLSIQRTPLCTAAIPPLNL